MSIGAMLFILALSFVLIAITSWQIQDGPK